MEAPNLLSATRTGVALNVKFEPPDNAETVTVYVHGTAFFSKDSAAVRKKNLLPAKGFVKVMVPELGKWIHPSVVMTATNAKGNESAFSNFA